MTNIDHSTTKDPDIVRDPRRWLVLAVMSLGTLIVFFDLTIVNTALPSISTDLGATTSDLQWVVDSYVLVLAGLLILAGSIGDKFGRKRWMTVGLVFFLVGSVVAGLANGIPVLITGRAIQGLGAAFVLPATLSIVTNTFERDERGKAIAVWTAVGGIGIGVGPAIGGSLVDAWGWSAGFWIHVPLIAAVLVGQSVVSESKDNTAKGLDIPGAITATLGISTLVFGIIQGAEAGWTSPLIVASFVAAITMLGAFITIELRTEHPMLPLHFFREKDFSGSVLVIAMMFFAGPPTFFFLTQFLQIVQERSALGAGLLTLPNAGAVIVASALAPKLASTLGPRRTVVLGATIMAVAMVLFAQVDASWGAWSVMSAIVVLGFGFGIGMPALTDSIMAAVPVEDAGIGSAVNDVSRELGAALGVAIVGSVINGIYRSDVADRLGGNVSAEALEAAEEGVGVLAANASTLPGQDADTTIAVANDAFIGAMSVGFWFSAALLGVGAVVAFLLLPDRARIDQASRSPISTNDQTDAGIASHVSS